MKAYNFYKEPYGGWYIDLPEYLKQGGNKGDLAMVAGADTMLDFLAAGADKVSLILDLHPFPGSDELTLVQKRDLLTGGGDYMLRTFEGLELNHAMWLCDVTEYVFGFLPARIYVKRAG